MLYFSAFVCSLRNAAAPSVDAEENICLSVCLSVSPDSRSQHLGVNGFCLLQCQTFIQLLDVSREEPASDDAYKAMTAMGILSSLQTLIMAVHNNNEANHLIHENPLNAYVVS